MKNIIQKFTNLAVVAAGVLLTASSAQATNYAGNGNTGFGSPVGNGTLSVTDDGTNITVNFQRGSGTLNDLLVIYIDTGSGEYGYNDTSGFTSTGGYEQKAISGYAGGSARSVMSFTNGFSPNYAVVIKGSFMDLWTLANPASFGFISGASQGGGSSANFTLTFPCGQIGLSTNTMHSIKLFGTLISNTAYRSTEAIAGNDYSILGGQGSIPFAQTAFAIYNFDAPPAPSYPVTFSVDMTEEIALGNFNPGNGDTVSAAGTFQTNVWSGFQLTNNPAAANTNIYSGTYPDYNPTNTAEQYKFTYYSVSGNNVAYEDQDNRPFTLTAAGVTNPLVYFADVFPNPSATTNYLSFSIDMTVQVELNHFDPANGDQIEVFGTLESPKWTGGAFVLTNNPTISGNGSNIYSGTIADGNYPGSFENYKYVIVQSGGNIYESGNNHDFFTPTNSYTFPIAYFNNILSAYSTPVTFSVDMTDPLFTGVFNPGNGDMVYAAGMFQTNHWDIQSFALTNDPDASNPNIYSGTYNDPDAPGTGEQYLFVVMSGGQTNYESRPNRIFFLPATATNLPLALWSDVVLDTNNYVSEPTTITFTVNMTNAVDVFGYPFDPANDAVVIDGDFLNPTWPKIWTDPLLGGVDYTANLLQNDGTDLLYTGTFSVPAGHSLQVSYKYGIIHGYTGTSNTNCDNEAPYGDNRNRWIRMTGTYNFPVDNFGSQGNSSSYEPSFGSLAIGSPGGGQLPLSWLGRPGVYLQYSTNLAGPWVQLPLTDAANSSSWPTTNPGVFFRLVNP